MTAAATPSFRLMSGVHILRHLLFAPRMRGAPARTIQELAGHQDLTTTQRCMHLSPAAVDSAILCWITEGRCFSFTVETIGETETAAVEIVNRDQGKRGARGGHRTRTPLAGPRILGRQPALSDRDEATQLSFPGAFLRILVRPANRENA